jgi:LacI family transcriptional regulator
VPFAHVWADRLREFLADEGYTLQIHSGRRWYSPHPERDLAALTHGMPAAVWVLFVATEAMQRWFAQSSLVCVTSGSSHPGIRLPSVDLDHRATCRHAAGQLLLRGHERVAFLRQGPVSAGDLASERGFLEAFEGKIGALPVLAEHDGTVGGIHRQLDLLLRREQPPTGFLTTRAMPTLAVASGLIRRGFRLGQDVALIGRDSDQFLEYFSPSIARYGVDPRQHAQRLARLVLQHARGGSPRTREVRLMPDFLPGESLGEPIRSEG